MMASRAGIVGRSLGPQNLRQYILIDFLSKFFYETSDKTSNKAQNFLKKL